MTPIFHCHLLFMMFLTLREEMILNLLTKKKMITLKRKS